jgi:heptosyltransferase-1
MARPLNILLVRVSSLGDVLHNLPMVADIARHFPDANIDWVVEEGFVSLVRMNARVRNVIPFALRRWRKSLGKAETRAEIKAFFRTCASRSTTTCSIPRACSRPASSWAPRAW